MIRSYFKNKKGGYTLLFAVLVSALVLAVGISILNISRKELILTAGERASGYAFYAADAGYECGVYWNSKGAFPESGGTPATSINCGQTTEGTGNGVPVQEGLPADPGTDPTTYSFSFQVPTPSGITPIECATVTVVQTPATESAPATTDIYSQGYNSGWTGPSGDCSLSGDNKVERELHASY